MARSLFTAAIVWLVATGAVAAALPYAPSPHHGQPVMAAADLSIHFG